MSTNTAFYNALFAQDNTLFQRIQRHIQNGNPNGAYTELPEGMERATMEGIIQHVTDNMATSPNVSTPQTARPTVSFPPGIGSVASNFPPPPSSVPTSAPAASILSVPPPAVSTSTAPPPAPPAPNPEEDVTEEELRAMWGEIDEHDVTLMSEDVVKAFEYQGFNPDAVLKSMMIKCKKDKVPKKEFLDDVTTLCTLAIIKGSVNDNNLKKMSDAGKARYDVLEKKYGITRGGGKGKPAEVITVARIAAAFPGKVIELLQNKKVPGRKFIADLQTYKLPGVIQHQALAACIPREFGEGSKQFLLDLVTAFSVDQTKVISKSKEDVSVLIERQAQFTNVSHNGNFPEEKVRVKIFKKYDWSKLFSDILPIATHIKTKWPTFHMATATEFLADVGKLP